MIDLLGEAIRYTLDHWPELIYFTKDGRVSPDNNIREGALRVPKLGWKNFLFVQSELGAEAVAGFYTILATCVMHGVHPIEYLSDVLAKLNCGWKKQDLDELLPWNLANAKAAAEDEKRKTRIERLSVATVLKLVKPENRIRDLKAKQAAH